MNSNDRCIARARLLVMYKKELDAGLMPAVCMVALLVEALALVIQNGNGFPLQISASGFAPVDVWIATSEKIMPGKPFFARIENLVD